jgi:hypothetical protein
MGDKIEAMTGRSETVQPGPRWTPATREAVEGYIFILPWLLGFLIFLLGPI